jgi:antitoxin ParD1/3/4
LSGGRKNIGSSLILRSGLRALQERDEAVERWLRDEVAPTYDRMQSDPKRGVSASKVFTDIRASHVKRLKAKA